MTGSTPDAGGEGHDVVRESERVIRDLLDDLHRPAPGRASARPSGRSRGRTGRGAGPGPEAGGPVVRPRAGGQGGPGSERIPGRCLGITPSGLTLAPRAWVTVHVALHVPDDARQASYVGLVQAAGRAGVQSLVSVRVV